MLSLRPHHITDLYCLIDDLLPQPAHNSLGGRPVKLSTSELVTLLVWNTLTTKQKTLKDIYRWALLYHREDFPRLPRYNGFLSACHRVTPDLLSVLGQLLEDEAAVRIMDATMLPVCKRYRADSHKVAKHIAKFGKNYQGWHYGFKLHASIDGKGRFSGLALTPANVHDAQMMPHILNEYAKVAVGDTLYGASVMRKKIFERYGTIVVAPPHPKQNKKLITAWQHLLLNWRSKIESVFDYLKEHLHLVSSFPRSVKGYLLHYVRILLGYQMMVI